MVRSVTTELELEAGQYSVMIKVIASKNSESKTPEQVIKQTCQTRPHKLMSVGLSYDLAHAKGRLKEDELERQERLRGERRDERKSKAKKAFEVERIVKKKEKLRRLRLEAKEGPKKGEEKELAEATDKETKSSSNVAEGEAVVDNKDATKDGNASNGVESGKETQITNPETNQLKDNEILKAVSPEDTSQETQIKPQGDPKNGENVDKKAASAEKEGADGQQSVVQSTNPSAAGGGNANTTEAGGKTDTPKADNVKVPIEKLTLDNISDDGLSWSSDIDAPSDSSSESDAESESDSPPIPAPESPEAAATDFTSSPWNAVCVVGLRIYAKGSQAEIKVVRKQDEGASVGKEKLDVDDQAADATKELQKGDTAQEKLLDAVGSADQDAEEESKQG